MNKLHMKFSALNVDFNGPSLDFLGSRKPAHEDIKEWYPRKSRYFSDVGQSQLIVKTVADKHGYAIGFHASREQAQISCSTCRLSSLKHLSYLSANF